MKPSQGGRKESHKIQIMLKPIIIAGCFTSVKCLIHQPLFQEELDRLGYQGELPFRSAQRAQRDDERTQKPEYQKVKQLWEQMTDIPEHGRAKVIADREGIKASYVTVLRWIRDWRHKG